MEVLVRLHHAFGLSPILFLYCVCTTSRGLALSLHSAASRTPSPSEDCRNLLDLQLAAELCDQNGFCSAAAGVNFPGSRRLFLQGTVARAMSVGGLALSQWGAGRSSVANANEWDTIRDGSIMDPNNPYAAYRIFPDPSEALNPTLLPVQNADLIREMSDTTCGALWLGEHHNSIRDHKIQAVLLRQIHDLRQSRGYKTAVGLEQVQVQFQPYLDEYITGTISLQQMKEFVEWDKRWTWPFETYETVFTTAKELGIPLVALNVNSEDLGMVERGGLPGLPRDRLRDYIVDPQGFANFARQRKFVTYVDYVIRPSYDMHEAMGLLRYTMSGEKLPEPMSYRNFFSGRILWDEAMASRAFRWTRENPDGLLVGLVGADHVKFRCGIPARYERMSNSAAAATFSSSGDEANTDDGVAAGTCTSVMLNPTLIDTRPAGTVGMEGSDAGRPDTLTLQVRYLKDDVDVSSSPTILSSPSSTGGVLPLADFVIVG